MRRRWWPVAVLFTVSSTVFLRCWNYGLINLDDYNYLYAHPEICDGFCWASVRFLLTDLSEGIWMPLTWVSYCIDFALFGDWTGGFHLHSIFIHAINSILVWLFLRCLFKGRDGLCLIAALFWAIHPLRCESVVFLASRKDVLSFFWEMLALICWIRGGYLRTALAILFFILGSMCKPSIMTFPVLCAIVDLFIVREIRIRRYIIPVAYMIFLGIFANVQQAVGGAMSDLSCVPLWWRLLNACAAFGIYVSNTIFPRGLAVQCVSRWPEFPRFLLPGLLISMSMGGWLIWWLRRIWERRGVLFEVRERKDGLPLLVRNRVIADPILAGALWFAISVFPMLGIATFGYHAFADRFTYIPSVGISLILIALMARWTSARSVVTVALVGLTFCSWRQTGFWKDDYTAFSRTLEVDGEKNSFAHLSLAKWYFVKQHDLERFLSEYETALKLRPEQAIELLDLYIVALSESGQCERIPEAMKILTNLAEKSLGAERVQMALSMSAYGLTPEERSFRGIYLRCKVAWNLSSRDGVEQAEELLRELDRAGGDKLPLLQFYHWRIAVLRGDVESEQRYAEELKKSNPRNGYLSFNYLFRK